MKPLLFLDAQKPTSMYLTGTRVDEWVDANGSGKKVATAVSLGTSYNPTFNSALFGGKGGITFNNKYLESPAAFAELNWKKGFAIFFAAQFRKGFFAASDAVAILAGMGLGRTLGFGTAANNMTSLPEVPCISGVLWDGIAFQFILAGKLYPVTQGSPSPGSAAFGKLQIGGIIGSAGAMDMDVAGVQIFNEELSPDDVVLISAAMQAQYGFAAPVVPTHNVMVDGNSLAVGYITSDDKVTMWTGAKAAGIGAEGFINVATSGLETLGMTSRAVGLVDSLLNPAVPSKRRILMVWEITNDLANLAQTDTAAYANIKAYCQARKAAGWRIILATCLPRTAAGINTNFETYRLSVNTMINANAISEGWADAIANIGADATIGVTGASNNTTYYLSDKTHLNSAGHNIASGYIASALTAIL